MLLEEVLAKCEEIDVCFDAGSILLRPLGVADAESLAKIADDVRVAATTTNLPHPYTLQDAKSWIKSHEEQRQKRSALHWAITETNNHRVVGVISLEISLRDRLAHLGYWLGCDYWGRGWGTQAAQKISRWALSAGFEKIAARCLSINIGSIKVLERCGFSQEGLLKSHVIRQSVRHDVLCFGLLSSKSIREEPKNS